MAKTKKVSETTNLQRLDLAKRCRAEAEDWKGSPVKETLLKAADELPGNMQEIEDRVLFQRWAKSRLLLDRSISGRYTDVDTDRSWAIWQAASEAIRTESCLVECVDDCADK